MRKTKSKILWKKNAKKVNNMKFLALLFIIFAQSIIFPVPRTYAATTRVGLGTAGDFAVLGGSGITNTGPTTINGNVGTFPTTTETGFGSVTINGANHTGDAVTQGAKNDLTTAYNDAAGRSTTATIATQLGGATLTDGVYDSADTTFQITGTLTLDGQGNADSVFIFKMGSTLTTASSSNVVLTNGAQACNVFWQVGSSATLGTTTNFIGNILALTSVTLNTGATVNGRVLARNGEVTLDTNTVTRTTCAAGTAGADAVLSSSTSTTSSPCPPTNYVTPIIIESKRVDADSIFISWGPYSGTDKFNVRYGSANGNWLYNANVTGFFTTINALPANQPFWFQVAARNDCSIGTYGEAKFSGGPSLPNAGFIPVDNFNKLLSLLFFRPGSPVRLVIPAINVKANIQNIGVTPNGEMALPDNVIDVGWFDLGSRPGEIGSAVIAGHLNGVFTNLNKLKIGDELFIENNQGVPVAFVVKGSQLYDPGYADNVFSRNDGKYLNLITCDGTWDKEKQSYSRRLVVLTEIREVVK